jgi:hypothetical protein
MRQQHSTIGRRADQAPDESDRTRPSMGPSLYCFRPFTFIGLIHRRPPVFRRASVRDRPLVSLVDVQRVVASRGRRP